MTIWEREEQTAHFIWNNFNEVGFCSSSQSFTTYEFGTVGIAVILYESGLKIWS